MSSLLAGHLAPQVSLSCMHRVAQIKFDEGLQHNTCRTYHGKQWTFWTFCAQYQLTAFPASEDMPMVFVTYLDDHLHRCYATIHHYMAAICTAHTSSTPTALGNLPSTTPAPARLGPARHHHRIPLLGQASTLAPQCQGQHAMGSPNHQPLWPLLQWQTGSTQDSRGQSSPVHKGVGHHPSLHVGLPTLCVH